MSPLTTFWIYLKAFPILNNPAKTIAKLLYVKNSDFS